MTRPRRLWRRANDPPRQTEEKDASGAVEAGPGRHVGVGKYQDGGAKASAVPFSLIETAKENGVDPYKYLTWVLTEANRKPAAELVTWKFM